MASEYRVKTVKQSGEPDQYGNYGYWVEFEGHQSSVLMRAKNAPEVGGMEYGTVSQETSKAGKPYFKFKREQREDGQQFHSEVKSFKGEKKEWQPRDDNAIRAQWAIGQAVTSIGKIPMNESDYAHIELVATKFYSMVDRVKGNDPKEQRGIEDKPTGYAAFQAAGGQVKSEALANELPPTSAYSDVDIQDIDDSPIDLSQIPF